MSPLAGWADFYVVTGTAAATLTGLMFMVVTLVAGRSERPSFDGAGVYSTPTVVHFGVTLQVIYQAVGNNITLRYYLYMIGQNPFYLFLQQRVVCTRKQ